jgi:urease accessory protein
VATKTGDQHSQRPVTLPSSGEASYASCMTSLAQLLHQRSSGSVDIRVGPTGVEVMREAGSAKCRMPRGTFEAILINTSGGLAGGDRTEIKATVTAGAALTLTGQTAERVYRTLGPAAEVKIKLCAEAGSTLLWMPQESIFFEGSCLERSLDVELRDNATFLAVEAMLFGRREMGEYVKHVSVVDRWNIYRDGGLIHTEVFRLGPNWPVSKATFGDNHAAATVLLVSEQAESLIDKVRAVIGPNDGASAWNGKLIARLVAKDGFLLRKSLIQVFAACVGRERVPKTWTF